MHGTAHSLRLSMVIPVLMIHSPDPRYLSLTLWSMHCMPLWHAMHVPSLSEIYLGQQALKIPS